VGAICGLFLLDGRPVRREVLTAQLDALAHRGAVGGAWTSGGVGLGWRGAEAAGGARPTQPLVYDGGRLVLVADARIDNAVALASMLGVGRAELDDAAIILRAYQRWGSRCPEHLIGDFTFAIWDRRTNAVFCARDPMGVKPLYYHHSDRVFAFPGSRTAP
jgi:asparagine synthase (glutamine-hydrolysing)